MCTSAFAHSDSAHQRHCSAHKRRCSAHKRHGSAHKRRCSAHRRHGSAHRQHGSAHRQHGSARRQHCSAHWQHCSAHRRHYSAQQAALVGTARGCVRLCLPPSPTLRTAARATVVQRREGEPYIYIRVRRREGENVLHRAASNDVDNFSVDNPLWITVAGGCRLLRGRRRRRCGGSVNAGTPFRSQGCDFTAWTGRTYIIIYACARSAAANVR